MNAKEHPDYEQEREKLAVVQSMISDEHETLIAKSQNYGKLAGDVITDPDVLRQLIEMDEKRLKSLTGMQDKPYFGRVDFHEVGRTKETYYIGRAGVEDPSTKEPIVLDWRAPLAGLYYSGEIGDVMYASPDGLVMGDLLLKRQYEIARGRLINIFDKGLTPMDEFLQKALWEKKDNRLNDIVTTIQDEQNQIIRAAKEGVLIIQGVAGSGKTTIALHRIAYLMYTYQDIFRADKILMLVPNRLFLDYISDVLPDLGVSDIAQITFDMLFEKVFNTAFMGSAKIDKLRRLIELDQTDATRQKLEYISAFKGSMALKQILDRYVHQLAEEAQPIGPIQVEDMVLYTAQELLELYQTHFAYLPIYKRKIRIQTFVKDTVKGRIEGLKTKLDKRCNAGIAKLKKSALEVSTQKIRIGALIDQKEAKIKALSETVDTAIHEYFSSWLNLNGETLLIALLGDAQKLAANAEGILTPSQVAQITDYTKYELHMKLEYEDLPALMYLRFILEGSALLKHYNHIIIDEAQDYNPLQMHLMKMISANGSFTIVGDIAQGINAYRGISEWDALRTQVFDARTVDYKTITICYRSTQEIVAFGNAVIQILGDDQIVPAKPALRFGSKPRMIASEDAASEMKQVNAAIDAMRQHGYQSIAVICKSQSQCALIFEHLSTERAELVQHLTDQETHYENGITVLTPQLSKGLEFDVVMIIDNIEDPYAEDDPFQIKLFYVAVSRALHALYVFHKSERSPLLNRIDPTLYQISMEKDITAV